MLTQLFKVKAQLAIKIDLKTCYTKQMHAKTGRYESLYTRTDKALYESKETGRNKTSLAPL